jgi:sigma-B regulation protein RsbU (phosphoserine phosphatase)
MIVDWRQIVKSVGGVEKAFFSLLGVWGVLSLAGLTGVVVNLVFVAMLVTGAWAGLRLIARGIRQAIWQLRNRLYVTYIFIAFVPILLLLVLTQLGASFLAQQIGVYLVNSELERRVSSIEGPANGILRAPAQARAEVVRRTGFILRDRFPGLQILVRDGAAEYRYPEESVLEAPPAGWENARGLVVKDGHFHAWSHKRQNDLEVVIVAPVTRAFLMNLVPDLGSIDLVWFPDPYADPKSPAPRAQPMDAVEGEQPVERRTAAPPPVNRLDQRVLWATPVPAGLWESPGSSANYLLSVRTRVSTILGIVFKKQSDEQPQGLLLLLYLFIGLFVVVELVSLIIGVSLTRTITTAVQALYDGTVRVKEGDLAHRIPVQGGDQLADLAVSFNTMTENLQRLVVVEKERERLHAELEIAREVQDALYPRMVPKMKTLTMTAGCAAARTVSGDYYDYQTVGEGRVAIAVGDVAGKGISAALLMATVQSSFRTQIRACVESAAAAAGGRDGGVATIAPASTSALVTQLNQQLYDYTAAEKYATFYYAVYDDVNGVLTYTNAGHLPPMLIRDGEVTQLDINGMVVGAFPFARYGESTLQMEPGDLLVCFTDGVTEPENEYGEMFGEDRLAQMVVKNIQRTEQEIINAVVEAVREWTGTPELQDDMTLLLARRL